MTDEQLRQAARDYIAPGDPRVDRLRLLAAYHEALARLVKLRRASVCPNADVAFAEARGRVAAFTEALTIMGMTPEDRSDKE